MPAVGEYFTYDEENPEEIILMNEGIDLMGIIAESDEITIFDSQNIMDIIDFKWNTFGKSHHKFGFIMHMVYVLLIMLYVNFTYCYDDVDDRT